MTQPNVSRSTLCNPPLLPRHTHPYTIPSLSFPVFPDQAGEPDSSPVIQKKKKRRKATHAMNPLSSFLSFHSSSPHLAEPHENKMAAHSVTDGYFRKKKNKNETLFCSHFVVFPLHLSLSLLLPHTVSQLSHRNPDGARSEREALVSRRRRGVVSRRRCSIGAGGPGGASRRGGGPACSAAIPRRRRAAGLPSRGS